MSLTDRAKADLMGQAKFLKDTYAGRGEPHPDAEVFLDAALRRGLGRLLTGSNHIRAFVIGTAASAAGFLFARQVPVRRRPDVRTHARGAAPRSRLR